MLTARESLPVDITEESLQENPECAKLLVDLTQHIASSGVSKQLDLDLIQVCP